MVRRGGWPDALDKTRGGNRKSSKSLKPALRLSNLCSASRPAIPICPIVAPFAPTTIYGKGSHSLPQCTRLYPYKL